MHVEVTHYERVGADWIECARCGCKHPPDEECPFQKYHDDPTQIPPEDLASEPER